MTSEGVTRGLVGVAREGGRMTREHFGVAWEGGGAAGRGGGRRPVGLQQSLSDFINLFLFVKVLPIQALP